MPFLEEKELERVAVYKENMENGSLSYKLFYPLLNRLANYIPEYVAPNVVSMCSTLCVLQAAFLCFHHMDKSPASVSAVSAVLLFLSWLSDILAELHAKKTANDTVVTTLFANNCNTMSALFLPYVMCAIMGVTNVLSLWYFVQASQLFLMNHHIYGFLYRKNVFRLFTGPGDLILLLVAVIFARAYFGLGIFYTVYVEAFRIVHTVAGDNIVGKLPTWNDEDPEGSMEQVAQAFYVCIMVFTLVRLMTFPKEHASTRNGLLFCLLYRVVPVGMILTFDTEITLIDAMCDGLFFTMVTADLIVAKMGGRELHPWIVVFAMGSVFSLFVILASYLLYIGLVLSLVSTFTRIPLLSVCINVYCDGVYDMCHFGHMRAFENAIKHGTRLIVGVCSDEDVMAYKRAPVMTTEERVRVVERCKHVYKVIQKCPSTRGSLDKEFIKKHRIHIVCCGEEYQNNPNDEWYRVPREMGIIRSLPRTGGVSTSNLIKRIQTRYEEEGEDKPKDLSQYTATLNGSPLKTTAGKKKKV